MTSSPPAVRAWERAMEKRSGRHSRDEGRGILGLLGSAILGLGLAMLAAALSRS